MKLSVEENKWRNENAYTTRMGKPGCKQAVL